MAGFYPDFGSINRKSDDVQQLHGTVRFMLESAHDEQITGSYHAGPGQPAAAPGLDAGRAITLGGCLRPIRSSLPERVDPGDEHAAGLERLTGIDLRPGRQFRRPGNRRHHGCQ